MTSYELKVMEELSKWQKKMLRKPSYVNRVSKNLQNKINELLPEKLHRGLTKVIKEMVRAVLFGSKYTTRKPVKDKSLEVREAIIQEKINSYRQTAAAEGGITGAGGFVFSLADFPLLLTIKFKLLFEIAAIYGYSGKDYRERLYILYIFQLAFSSREHQRNIFLQMVDWDQKLHELPEDIHQFNWRTFQQEYRDYLDVAKLAQMIPIIGAAVGFVVNYRLVNKLGETAMNAYRMRWKVNPS